MDNTYFPADPGGAYDDYEGSYGMMSGTSMAAPHMTGLTALVQEYVREELGVTATVPRSNLAQQLLMSTALPMKDADGVYYSPRQQGAGLANVANAVRTPAYITVQGQSVGKLELKDDPQKTGSYHMEFTVRNLTDQALTYNAKAVVLVPSAQTADTQYGQRNMMLASDVLLREVDLGPVTVSASGSAVVSQDVALTSEERRSWTIRLKTAFMWRALSFSPMPRASIPRSACPSWLSMATGLQPPSLTPPPGWMRLPMARTCTITNVNGMSPSWVTSMAMATAILARTPLTVPPETASGSSIRRM